MTELRAENARLRGRLKECEEVASRYATILREGDHRIKNSLQIVSGLMHLQARREESPSASLALRAAAARVQSIARIHDALQASHGEDTVDLGQTLKTMCQGLQSMAGDPLSVEVLVHVEPIAAPSCRWRTRAARGSCSPYARRGRCNRWGSASQLRVNRRRLSHRGAPSGARTMDQPADLLPLNAPARVAPPLYPGDPAPWFTAPSDANPRFQFSSLGGRPAILAFVESMRGPAGEAMVAAFLAATPELAKTTTALLIVTADFADADATVPDDLFGIRYIFDPARTLSKIYGACTDDGVFRPTTFIVDRRLRVFAVVPARETEGHVESVLAHLARIGAPQAGRSALPQAPVLIIPNVFEASLCQRLIAGYEAQGGVETGFMVERNGLTVEERNHDHKRRADWGVQDMALLDACRVRIKRRIGPELQRAFQFEATRIERYLVACYSADVAGHFAPHRDNTTKGTAHRRFAVSINLNSDYEGGHLVFPEFGRAHFKPPAGGACVFSCSMLHEATTVTKGKRYVFVPFLYDELAREIRDENLKHIGPRE